MKLLNNQTITSRYRTPGGTDISHKIIKEMNFFTSPIENKVEVFHSIVIHKNDGYPALGFSTRVDRGALEEVEAIISVLQTILKEVKEPNENNR